MIVEKLKEEWNTQRTKTKAHSTDYCQGECGWVAGKKDAIRQKHGVYDSFRDNKTLELFIEIRRQFPFNFSLVTSITINHCGLSLPCGRTMSEMTSFRIISTNIFALRTQLFFGISCSSIKVNFCSFFYKVVNVVNDFYHLFWLCNRIRKNE